MSHIARYLAAGRLLLFVSEAVPQTMRIHPSTFDEADDCPGVAEGVARTGVVGDKLGGRDCGFLPDEGDGRYFAAKFEVSVVVGDADPKEVLYALAMR